MEKFRILLLNSLSIYGGGEFYVYQLAKALKNQGHEIWVSCRNDVLLFKKCSEEGINIFPIDYPVNGKSDLIKIINLLKNFIKENNIRLVHTNTNFDRTAGAFAAGLAKVPCVATVHSYFSIRNNLTHWLRNKYFIDNFIADSSKIKELLINKDKIKPSKISLVNIGIDPAEMKRDNEAGKKIREELSIPENAVVIGNVGRMVEFKGQEFLIKAFAEARKKNNNIRLIITGDGELKNKLMELTDNIDVKEDIYFTGFREDLNIIYSAFDIYAQTSLEGGGELFPISILNALSQGLPVIASDAGDICSMVINNKNGYLTKPEDTAEISKRIVELSQNEQLRKELGNNGHIYFMQNFTIEKMVSEISDIYSRIINN